MAVMDTARWARASTQLDHILDLTSGDRDRHMAALRAEDASLAADLQVLLDEHRVVCAEGFLEDLALERPMPPVLAGANLGSYTLVEPIGYGGMGSVWRASRSDGRFEGQAAVKLLNAELVGHAGGERFKREGTILARLTHAHIARLIDAGVSSAGQPYLVLEHVDGRHIDHYCDDEQLGLEARIELFLDVLSAVAHAHANLIVHRDLKPSNVLVTQNGQVKLLDFGIAKLIEDENRPQLEPTITREAGSALTPKYAAPEQLTGGAITTATDVYTLGVLLYELLSGSHPLGGGALSPAEMVRAIVDTEPPSLSAAAARALPVEKWRRRLRGDLDTIVGKALKKNPAERYASVAELADDLRRFVEHLPISARPDTIAYRAAKFARRHRRGLAVSMAAALLLTATTAFYTVTLARERDHAALQAAKASKVSQLLGEVLTGADPYLDPNAQQTSIRGLLDRGAERVARDLKDQPDVQAEMFTSIGRVYQRLGLYDKAMPLLHEALTLGRRTLGPEHVSIAQSLNDLGVLHREHGDPVSAQPLLEESLAMRRHLLGSAHKDVAVTLLELSRALRDRGLDTQAEPLIRESLAIRRKVLGATHRETATSQNDLALLLVGRGDLDAAESQFRESLTNTRNALGPDHPNVAVSMGNLGLVLNAKGDHAAADTLLRQDVATLRKVLGVRHPAYAYALNNLATVVFDEGHLDEARTLLEQAIAIVQPIFSADHPRLALYQVNLARVQIARREGAAAEPALRHALDVRRRLLPASDWRIGQAQSLLGASLLAQRRYDEAEPLLLSASTVLKSVRGAEGQEAADNSARLTSLYAARAH